MRSETTKARRSSAGRSPSRIAAALVVACGFVAGGAAAAPNIDAPITATWTGVGLRSWSGSLAAQVAVPIVVDRRLDPDRPITLDCREEPLRDVVGRVAAQAGGELAVLVSSLHIVPPGMADLLIRAEDARTARLAELPAAQKAIAAVRRPWRWPAGAVPAELVETVAEEAGISVDGTASLPHDHLPAVSLPPLSLAERLDLLLAHYDRRIEWRSGDDGRPTGRIVRIDAGLPPRVASADGKRPVSERRTPARKPPRRQPAGRRDTFSLQVAAPLDQVLGVIAKRLDLRLDIDADSLRRSGVAPGEIVKATVKDASREQLLDAILEPLRLHWKIDAGTLRVSADPSEQRSGSRPGAGE